MEKPSYWYRDESKIGAAELARCVKEIMQPPPEGADLGAILGAYIFKGVLMEVGLDVVPLNPTAEMQKAFQSGRFRSFPERYAAMLAAAWKED